MTQDIGIWDVGGGSPRKLPSSNVDLEQELEEWIEQDPALLEGGLTIVGRQVPLDAGTLDLLALDAQGQWVVVELKRGNVRRETVAQALDYASCVATMPYEALSKVADAYLNRGNPLPARSLEALLNDRAGGGVG